MAQLENVKNSIKFWLKKFYHDHKTELIYAIMFAIMFAPIAAWLYEDWTHIESILQNSYHNLLDIITSIIVNFMPHISLLLVLLLMAITLLQISISYKLKKSIKGTNASIDNTKKKIMAIPHKLLREEHQKSVVFADAIPGIVKKAKKMNVKGDLYYLKSDPGMLETIADCSNRENHTRLLVSIKSLHYIRDYFKNNNNNERLKKKIKKRIDWKYFGYFDGVGCCIWTESGKSDYKAIVFVPSLFKANKNASSFGLCLLSEESETLQKDFGQRLWQEGKDLDIGICIDCTATDEESCGDPEYCDLKKLEIEKQKLNRK